LKELEIVVWRHELALLRRHVTRPACRSADRWFLAAAARVVPRVRWSSFLVTPATFCDGIDVSWQNAGPMDDDAVDHRSTVRFEC